MNQKRALKQLRELKKLGSKLRLAAQGWHKPWQILISTMLSARTRDTKTIAVSNVLYKKYPSLKKLAKSNIDNIKDIIKPINYYKTKSKNVLNCSKILINEYNEKVPLDIEQLLKLPGVGRKTANIFLSQMGKQTIGVDTHVSFISQKLGWTKNKKPYKIEEDLKRLFPKKYWKQVNLILVRFGQTYSKNKKEEILKTIKKVI
ncbi:MAG: endonuclease III [Candidatus Woesearchaeota archaeon]|nr:endonuclease III [Candidatus Woesearchaeota archaeon]